MVIIKKPIVLKTYYGTISFVDETGKGYECVIYNFEIKEKYRHMYLGTNILNDVLHAIHEYGYNKAFVVLKDESLRPFYEKLGFVTAPIYKNEMYYIFNKDKKVK